MKKEQDVEVFKHEENNKKEVESKQVKQKEQDDNKEGAHKKNEVQEIIE